MHRDPPQALSHPCTRRQPAYTGTQAQAHPYLLTVHTHAPTDTQSGTCTHRHTHLPGLPVPELPHTRTDPDHHHPPPTPLRLSGGLHPVWCPRLEPLATRRPGARSWQPRKSETRTEYLNLTRGSVLGGRYRPGGTSWHPCGDRGREEERQLGPDWGWRCPLPSRGRGTHQMQMALSSDQTLASCRSAWLDRPWSRAVPGRAQQ